MTTPQTVTSVQVRAELEDLLMRDLHGPWDGPEEELPPGTRPAERYMLGRLVPRERPADAPARRKTPTWIRNSSTAKFPRRRR